LRRAEARYQLMALAGMIKESVLVLYVRVSLPKLTNFSEEPLVTSYCFFFMFSFVLFFSVSSDSVCPNEVSLTAFN
jgi:hypothetical protein